MHILKVIFIILEVLLLFNLLIFVHELGHFLAGRWRGLKIERFAIWFGKPLWKKEIRGVEYVLGWIPAGGYVSLPQMAPMEMIEGKGEAKEAEEEELPSISALDKIIVAFAGPLFSFLLAIAFAFVVWGVRRPVSEAEATTTIGYVVTNSPAAEAGLRESDRILSVDGGKVSKFGGMGDSVTWRVVSSVGETIPIVVEREGKILPPIEVKPVIAETKAYERSGLREIGIAPKVSTIIAEVVPNSPAAMSGLRRRDEIVEINGLRPVHYLSVSDYIKAHVGDPLTLSILRGEKQFTVELKAEKPIEPADAEPAIGIVFVGNGKVALVRPGPIEQVRASVRAMVDTFSALLSSGSDVKAQHLGGAIKIMSVYYILFESEQGWRQALWFSVLMNVNLALLNLLPIPVLDGGHIVLALVEAVRRRPVSIRLLQWIQTGCAAALILFMLYIAFYDVQDLRGSKRPETKFAPKPTSDFKPLE